MLNKEIEKKLNEQLNCEFYSSYLYMSMAIHFDYYNFKGFSSWMKYQAQEELTHADKIYNYINMQGAKIELQEIPKPKNHWESALDVFKDALNHEKKVTKNIHELTNTAIDTKDHPTSIFLQEFVTEQVEEESSLEEIIQKLKLTKDNINGLYCMDRELGRRTH